MSWFLQKAIVTNNVLDLTFEKNSVFKTLWVFADLVDNKALTPLYNLNSNISLFQAYRLKLGNYDQRVNIVWKESQN